MSFRKRQVSEGGDSPSDERAHPDEAAEQVSGEASGPPTPDSELEQLAAERDEAVESWKRARADYQNLRRRLQSDVDSAVARSREGLLAELLLVLDTLEMALATECRTEEAKNLQFGVQMVRHQMLQFLEQQGVTQLQEGGAFDPETHQAIETLVSPEHSPGEIVETVRRGFRMGDRMLRHAHVKVAAEPGEDEGPSADAQAEVDAQQDE